MADDIAEQRFLTEPEAAQFLRRSTSAIKRLRLSGSLPYIPGRPVLIERSDLEAWVAAKRAEKLKKNQVPRAEMTEAELREADRRWVWRKKAMIGIRKGNFPGGDGTT